MLGIEGLQLIKNFITAEEEETILRHINGSTWNTSLKRRTQHYGYEYSYTDKNAAQEATPIPEWCVFVIDRLMEQKVLETRPDQLIVNEYTPGQGIYPHVDRVDAFEDGIVSISLGAVVEMDFIPQQEGKHKSIPLPRKSALVLKGDARYKWRHGIAARRMDHGRMRGTRISLTFRKVK